MVRHRGSGLLFTLIAFGMAIGSRPAHGQTISFLRPLNGVDPQVSTPGGGRVAADASGVYVGLDKGVLAKFDSHGNVLWTRATGAYDLYGPAADGAGVYVSGRIYNQPNPVTYFLRRYDGDGKSCGLARPRRGSTQLLMPAAFMWPERWLGRRPPLYMCASTTRAAQSSGPARS